MRRLPLVLVGLALAGNLVACSSSTDSSAAPAVPTFQITAPKSTDKPNGPDGVTVAGKAPNNTEVVVFDVDGTDLYYDDHSGVIVDGTWSVFDGPIGQKGDGTKDVTIRAIDFPLDCFGEFWKALKNPDGGGPVSMPACVTNDDVVSADVTVTVTNAS